MLISYQSYHEDFFSNINDNKFIIYNDTFLSFLPSMIFLKKKIYKYSLK